MKTKYRRKKNRTEKISLVVKWFFYGLLVVVAYVYMTTVKSFFPKPLLLIPIAINISMRESEMTSAITGLICGYVLDMACGKLVGFNAFLLMIFCLFTSLLFQYLMRQNVINIIAITFVATIIQGLLDFFFYYAIWGYDKVGSVFTNEILPSMIFTIIWSGILYVIVKFIYNKTSPATEHFIEEKSDNIVRE